jgi:hypothetical protein
MGRLKMKRVKYFKHLIWQPLVNKYCKVCPNYGGTIRNFGSYGLVIIKCEAVGAYMDENCDACTGTLTHLIKIKAPPIVIYQISEAIEQQRI